MVGKRQKGMAMTDQPMPIYCLHCGQQFESVEDVRRHQTLVDIAMNEPQILDWNLETNYINGEWEQ